MCYDNSMEPTILDQIIALLLSGRSTYMYRRILWARVNERRKDLKAETFRQHLYRLHKKGIIEPNGDLIYINKENLHKFQLKKNFLIKNVAPSKTQKVLLSFDIPEVKKKTRDWLRNQIKYWDFEMIHKSLWLGYGPLPKEFNERLKQLGISKNVRIFKIIKAT